MVMTSDLSQQANSETVFLPDPLCPRSVIPLFCYCFERIQCIRFTNNNSIKPSYSHGTQSIVLGSFGQGEPINTAQGIVKSQQIQHKYILIFVEKNLVIPYILIHIAPPSFCPTCPTQYHAHYSSLQNKYRQIKKQTKYTKTKQTFKQATNRKKITHRSLVRAALHNVDVFLNSVSRTTDETRAKI